MMCLAVVGIQSRPWPELPGHLGPVVSLMLAALTLVILICGLSGLAGHGSLGSAHGSQGNVPSRRTFQK